MNVCPNSCWDGCTHPHKVFKYKKAFEKHVAKCTMARKQTESEEMDLRPLMKQVVSRLSELEQQVALLKQENRHLRELIRAPTIRGAYEVRGEAHTPSHGFGRWDSDFFLANLSRTDEFIREKAGYGVLQLNFQMFLGAVFFVANGETHVVRIAPSTPVNRDGFPIKVDLNRKKRRRTVSWEAAIRQMFEHQFLPTVEQVEEVLGPMPLELKKKLIYYRHWMSLPPSKKHKDNGSWEAKCELLQALARFKVPQRLKKRTPAERADEIFHAEYNSDVGQWWRQPHQWPMTEIVETYDELLSESLAYKTALRAYFDERPDRLQEYHEAGGTLV